MLQLQHNKLDGDLPAELAWMESMQHLNLGANDLRGEMFELDRMTNLRCAPMFARLQTTVQGCNNIRTVRTQHI